jgi:hypothetical protein
MSMAVTSIRLPADTLAHLRRLAHLESLDLGRSITWACMVRELVDRHLRDRAEAERMKTAARSERAPGSHAGATPS